MEFKDVLIQFRGKRGTKARPFSQEQLARILDVSLQTVNRWENGKLPHRGTEKRILKKLRELDEKRIL